MEYQFQGGALGGKPNDRWLYDTDGKVLYSEIARHPAFLEAVKRLERYARDCRVALLCAEEDPTDCHRRLLVTRVLGRQELYH